MDELEKICSKCKTPKPSSEFHARKTRRGVQAYCKTCSALSHHEYLKSNGLRVVCKKHNTTVEWYEQRLALQEFACALCLIQTEVLCIDHDHTCCSSHYSCGKCIRGLLCQRCNRLLGQANDSPSILANAIRYLNGPATTKRRDPAMGCDSLNSFESLREKSEAVSPLVNNE